MQVPRNHYFVYIVGDKHGADMHIGIAGDLQALMEHEHQEAKTTDPKGRKLVYYEHYDQEEIALNRERQIKENSHDATVNLVDSMNPNWLDLSDTLNY